MRKNIKCKTQVLNSRSYKGLTNKELNLLMPSSKQLLLCHSSIKYRGIQQDGGNFTKQNIQGNKVQVIQPQINKQNENPIQENQIHKLQEIENSKSKNIYFQNHQNFRFVPQSHKTILGERTFVNLQLSSVNVLPFQDEQKVWLHTQVPSTSIHNILMQNQERQIKRDEKTLTDILTQRVQKLQNLVSDILKGKIIINQQAERNESKLKKQQDSDTNQINKELPQQYPPSLRKIQRAQTQYKPKSKVTFTQKILIQYLNDENDQELQQRSHREKDLLTKRIYLTTKKLKEDKEQTDLIHHTRLASSIMKTSSNIQQKALGSKIKIPPNTNMFIRKKKTLKLTANYQPICDITKKQLPQIKMRPYVCPIIPNLSAENYTPIKLKTQINLINL